jgi:hypothetical protein
MPWFQEFAGIAFTWQGTAAAPALRTTPIFALVPDAEVGDEPAGDVVEFTLERG